MSPTLSVRYLGLQPYEQVWEAMRAYTASRTPDSADELWVVEHPPVFTQGQAGKPEHILFAKEIPIIQSDRGGQVTYHGPGQLVVYVLIDVRRRSFTVRELVEALESGIIATLADRDIAAYSKKDAPGVYINEAKIASVGLRIKKGCSYHGLAFNIKMDLTPFSYINPCGYPSLKMTQLSDFIPTITVQDVQESVVTHIMNHLARKASSAPSHD